MPRRASLPALAIPIAAIALLPACGESPEPQAPTPAPQAQAPAHEAEATPAQPRTSQAAIAALDAYRAASAAGDGRRAVEFLHPSYFELTAGQIDAALDADAATLGAMDPMDRLMVYTLRIRLEPEELRTLTPTAMAAMAIDRGWIDDEVTGSATVTDARMLPEDSAAPDRALVFLEYQGTPIDAPIPVSYHEGRWLVDLAAMMADVGASFERMADQFGLTIEAFIVSALVAAEGRPLPEDIDQPVGRE